MTSLVEGEGSDWMADTPTLSLVGHGENRVELTFSSYELAEQAYFWLEAIIGCYLDLGPHSKTGNHEGRL